MTTVILILFRSDVCFSSEKMISDVNSLFTSNPESTVTKPPTSGLFFVFAPTFAYPSPFELHHQPVCFGDSFGLAGMHSGSRGFFFVRPHWLVQPLRLKGMKDAWPFFADTASVWFAGGVKKMSKKWEKQEKFTVWPICCYKAPKYLKTMNHILCES